EAYIVGESWNGLEGSTRQGVLVRLNAAGNGAPVSTVVGQRPPGGRFGCDYQDFATILAIDGSGNVDVAGFTSSPGFHPAGVPGLDQVYDGNGDGFVRRYNTSNTLTHSTLIGSPMYDDLSSLAIGTDGSIFSAGKSYFFDQLDGDVYIIRL